MKRHATPTIFKGAQTVRTWLHVKHGNIFERMAMAEAFESPPPFITSVVRLKHYLVRCGGAFSRYAVKRVGFGRCVNMTRMVVND